MLERALLPTVCYLAGPGEYAYFAQVAPVAEALGAALDEQSVAAVAVDDESACAVRVDRIRRFRLRSGFAVRPGGRSDCQRSSVAQWQSIRLLTGGLLVRVQPGELF